MRNALVLLGIAVMILAVAPSEASAAGPFCFSTPPFIDVFVWFVGTTGGNQFAGSGRDLAGGRAQTVSGFVSGNTATVGFVTHPGSSETVPVTVPVTGGGTINLVSGSGTGSCFGPDFASCGSFTFVSITCPAAATADSTGDATLPAGRVQGIVP